MRCTSCPDESAPNEAAPGDFCRTCGHLKLMHDVAPDGGPTCYALSDGRSVCDVQGRPCQTFSPLVPGLYQHWKGDYYEVLGVAIGASFEPPTPVVVYQSAKTYAVFTRNLDEFVGEVQLPETEGYVSRFRFEQRFNSGAWGVTLAHQLRLRVKSPAGPLLTEVLERQVIEHSDGWHQKWRRTHTCDMCEVLEAIKAPGFVPEAE